MKKLLITPAPFQEEATPEMLGQHKLKDKMKNHLDKSLEYDHKRFMSMITPTIELAKTSSRESLQDAC